MDIDQTGRHPLAGGIDNLGIGRHFEANPDTDDPTLAQQQVGRLQALAIADQQGRTANQHRRRTDRDIGARECLRLGGLGHPDRIEQDDGREGQGSDLHDDSAPIDRIDTLHDRAPDTIGHKS